MTRVRQQRRLTALDHNWAYATEAPNVGLGRITDTGIWGRNRPIPAKNQGIDDHELRPLNPNGRTLKMPMSVLGWTADSGRDFDSDGPATDTDQFRVRPEIRLSGLSRSRLRRVEGPALAMIEK